MNITVTGAWGYSGGRIADRLLQGGHVVTSLTTHGPANQQSDPFGGQVAHRSPRSTGGATPAAGTGSPEWDRAAIRRALTEWETDVLVSNYWVRHDVAPRNHKGTWTRHERAVGNSRVLIRAANEAGVKRIVWTSITKADPGSDLPYFRGKGNVERTLHDPGFNRLECLILRPACFFGTGGPPGAPAGGILIENIGWACRRAPVMIIPQGECPVLPIHVDDFAELAVAMATGRDTGVRDACGPERYTLKLLVHHVGEAVGRSPSIWTAGPRVCRQAYRLVSLLTGETVVSNDELEGLSRGLLDADETLPAGTTRLSDWLRDPVVRSQLGRRLAREPAR